MLQSVMTLEMKIDLDIAATESVCRVLNVETSVVFHGNLVLIKFLGNFVRIHVVDTAFSLESTPWTYPGIPAVL